MYQKTWIHFDNPHPFSYLSLIHQSYYYVRLFVTRDLVRKNSCGDAEEKKTDGPDVRANIAKRKPASE